MWSGRAGHPSIGAKSLRQARRLAGVGATPPGGAWYGTNEVCKSDTGEVQPLLLELVDRGIIRIGHRVLRTWPLAAGR